MSDDLTKQLSSYKAQLQQVEVALSTDQENEDLLKLQKDLQVGVNVKSFSIEGAYSSLPNPFIRMWWLYCSKRKVII